LSGECPCDTVATLLARERVSTPDTSEGSFARGRAMVVNYISGLVFLFLMLVGLAVAALLAWVHPAAGVIGLILWFIADCIISSGVRLAAQWERGVVLRLGKYSTTKGPGLFVIIPMIDQVRMVDTRVLAVNIPKQQVITRDNVPVTIDAALFYQVLTPAEAILMVQDYRTLIALYAQTSLRDVIGQMTLDQLLIEREQIAHAIEQHVEKDTKGWGLNVTALRIQDIDMPEELKKMMSRQASAEREKRATITKAEGDKEAAVNLAHAARTMAESPGAMQLRTLQTIDGLGPSASNTVVLAVPIEFMEAVSRASAALANGHAHAGAGPAGPAA
jgi:regulator of protease activity HflC (stomatin/prohibitin superfamily)